MFLKWLRRIQLNLVLLASLYADNAAKRIFRKFYNFRGRFHFDDLSQGSDHLLIIVAGYKKQLWGEVFGRIRKSLPAEWDVCVCCPGVDSSELKSLCQTNRWSYLATVANKLSLAQNLAIARHPKAKVIVKMDEDIILAGHSLANLASSLGKAVSAGPFRPGLVAPLLNVNGFSSRILLEKLGRLEAYEAKFGRCIQSCTETTVWTEPEAARFLWEAVLPFDKTALRLAQDEIRLTPCPYRFSIGCFAMERKIWDAMGGFSVAPEGVLGLEEVDLSAYCAANAMPILVAENILVGHVGFGHQTALMTGLINQWVEDGLLS